MFFDTNSLLGAAILVHWAVEGVLGMRSRSLLWNIRRRACVHSQVTQHFSPGRKVLGRRTDDWNSLPETVVNNPRALAFARNIAFLMYFVVFCCNVFMYFHVLCCNLFTVYCNYVRHCNMPYYV
uniref:Uncharacterized protein n=1 Tax=Ixodes ricinus TaxID=34613 RepID=A0A6B0UP82_IXORI